MPRTIADLRVLGRDPFRIFRADETLAIDGAWLGRVLDGGPVAFWDDGEDDSTESDATPYQLLDGVAVLEIEGPLVQRGWMCWQGYDTIRNDLELALADRRVKSVLLRLNSPGGMAAGCFEESRRMRAAIVVSGKKVVAFADEMAYSAAYCLACVADEIVVPEPGGVGSVGVITSMQSVAKALADQGIDARVFASGAEKADGHPYVPISKEAAARTEARVEALAQLFARWVAERRGMAPEAVRALQAGVRYGAEAVSSGLADRVESYAALLASMREAAPEPTPATPARPAPAAPEPTPATRHSTMHPILAALAAANEAEALASVQNLLDLRTQLHQATDTTTDAEALGVLHAWKRDASAATELRATAERERQEATVRERRELLTQAVHAMKLTPAEAEADGQEGVWTTKLDNAGLRAFVARSGASVPTHDTRPRAPQKGAANASSLTADQRALADQLGLTHDEYAKALAAQD